MIEYIYIHILYNKPINFFLKREFDTHHFTNRVYGQNEKLTKCFSYQNATFKIWIIWLKLLFLFSILLSGIFNFFVIWMQTFHPLKTCFPCVIPRLSYFFVTMCGFRLFLKEYCLYSVFEDVFCILNVITDDWLIDWYSKKNISLIFLMNF